MGYFRELPEIQYSSPFKDKRTIQEYSTAKNLFKRPKLRGDIANIITAFNYYEIRDNERPEHVSQKFYGTPDNDWVILITNNIKNLNNEWPLDNNSLYSYMLQKYGSEENLSKIHHYETVEYRDKYNRIIIEEGIQVDVGKTEIIDTNTSSNSYRIESFPSSKGNTIISINLNQSFTLIGRDITSTYNITDITTNTSRLKVRSADGTEDINVVVVNSLADWPSSWGGKMTVGLRDGNTFDIGIDDRILDNKVRIPERLYEITGSLDERGILQPTFNFTNEIPAA